MLSLFARLATILRGRPCELPACPLAAEVRLALMDAQAYARSHGGDIQLIAVNAEGDVTVRLRGACASCPLSGITIRTAVERRLREAVPGVRNLIVI